MKTFKDVSLLKDKLMKDIAGGVGPPPSVGLTIIERQETIVPGWENSTPDETLERVFGVNEDVITG